MAQSPTTQDYYPRSWGSLTEISLEGVHTNKYYKGI